MDELIDLRSVQAVVVENEPANALQDIYKSRRPFDPQRVRAAAIACESPKLAVVAQVADDGSFAERLEPLLPAAVCSRS